MDILANWLTWAACIILNGWIILAGWIGLAGWVILEGWVILVRIAAVVGLGYPGGLGYPSGLRGLRLGFSYPSVLGCSGVALSIPVG